MVMNALTFDIEDYYHSFRPLGLCPPDTWTTYERRVEKVTHQLLDTPDTYGLKATCFVLGWVAEHHPGLVQEIARRGHEVASHGYWHELIYDQGPTAFRSDLERAKVITEDQLGAPVLGYRAPAFSVNLSQPVGPGYCGGAWVPV